ncbi:MAG: hypothetical protein H8F28_25015 [Fibrella sp.]|nr:hypothetical protein [Armatimonadota bacterium]
MRAPFYCWKRRDPKRSLPRSSAATIRWYVGDGAGRIRPVTPADIREALLHLEGLLNLLPNLAIVVLVGLKAQSAAKNIRALTAVPLVATPHPSGEVFNVCPDKKDDAEEAFREVAFLLGGRIAE